MKTDRGVVPVGWKTAPLLKSVSISESALKTNYNDKGADLKVVVLADSVQTVGGAVTTLWDKSTLTGADKERPEEEDSSSADDDTSHADGIEVYAYDVASDSAVSDAAVVTRAARKVVTNYEKARVENMIARVTVAVVYREPAENDYSFEEAADEYLINDTEAVSEETADDAVEDIADESAED
jgi:hypothetical protein